MAGFDAGEQRGVELARGRIAARIAAVRREAENPEPPRDGDTRSLGSSALLFHVIPVDPDVPRPDLSDPALEERMKTVPPFGAGGHGNVRYSLDGVAAEEQGWRRRRRRWTLVMRQGGLEFAELDAVQPSGWAGEGGGNVFDARGFETDFVQAIAQARELAVGGLVHPPAMVALSLLNVRGSYLSASSRHFVPAGSQLDDNDLIVDPEYVGDFDGALTAVGIRLVNTLWQGYGYARSPSFARAIQAKP